MKKSTALLLSACALPVALAFTAPRTTFTFAPGEGSSLRKTFTSEVDLTMDDMSFSMNGEAAPIEMDMDMNVTAVTTTVVTDEYGKMGDGAPLMLKRTFDELGSTTAMSMEMAVMGQTQSQDEDMDSSSELQGETVVFTWSEEEGGYKVAFPEDSEGDVELLEGLEQDMDLTALLPPGDVSEGDEWEIDVASLADILAPGGNLKLVPDEMTPEMKQMTQGMGGGGMGTMQDWLQDEIEGTASGKFAGMRDVDGVQLAVIEFTMNINTAVDMTEKVMEAMDEMPLPPGAEMEFDHLDLEFEMEATGQLYWNLKAGHFHSFEMSGSTSILVDSGMAMNNGGQEMTIESSLVMSGSISAKASAE